CSAPIASRLARSPLCSCCSAGRWWSRRWCGAVAHSRWGSSSGSRWPCSGPGASTSPAPTAFRVPAP
ncbi:MAG: hypothetical protein AVDCRST_MAG45-398, partial [uncultured Solirubrobacterales bacterium]